MPSAALPWACIVLCASVLSSAGAEPLKGGPCGGLADARVRDACGTAATALARSATKAPPIEATADAVSPVGSTVYVEPDRRALAKAPASFARKALRLPGARCTFADVGDYVCVVAGLDPLEVRATVIMPPPAQNAIETRCGPLTHARAQTCVGTIHFVASAVATETDGGRTTIVFRTPAVTVVRLRR